MKYKIIQWGPGYLGTQGIKYVLKHPMMELVGVKCFSKNKVGMDAGALCGLPTTGIRATADERELLDLQADCVVFTCNDVTMKDPLPGTMGFEFITAICRILESGKNVVATSPIPMLYPKKMGTAGTELVAMLNAAAIRGNSSVHFVGYEPGFIGDTLASILASISMDITSIRTYELVDWGNYPNHATMRALGMGCPPDDPNRPLVLELFKESWSTTVSELADLMNIKLDQIVLWDKPVVADNTFTTAGGLEIRKGTVAVGRWALEGLIGGIPRVAIEHCNRMRADLSPELPSVRPGGGYRIEIESNELPLSMDIHLGRAGNPAKTYDSFDVAMYGTVARTVNAIEMICRAPPGFISKHDLPPITGRNTMWL